MDLTSLNEQQKEAVMAPDKYMRVIAGAGSGKTRVLTMRVAHLVNDLGVYPNKILAITFTNKAANEMKERVMKMLPEATTSCWISTIHSLCVRILREDITSMGYPRNFTVMDADDQKSVIKEAYRKYGIDAQELKPGTMLEFISNNKSAGISVDRAFELAGKMPREKMKVNVYEFYVNRQKELYALDFDDLLLWTVRMFEMYPEILQKWMNRFHYILVDEFQDIDNIQYKLITQLTGQDNSLYVVGDPDQTIYTWRGANVDFIMHFEQDFKPCKTVILNQNYRSTPCILNGANSLIQNNKYRVKKDLFTANTSDVKITHYASAGDEYEAAWIADKIASGHREGKPYRDFAVLYRSNYLSRSIEKALVNARIPYVIYGGIKFYERAEIKDALSYLRLVSTQDDLAFKRIINVPRRGLGNKTIDTIFDEAQAKGMKMYDCICTEKLFSGKTQRTLDDFVNMIEKWRALADQMPVFTLLEKILQESGYRQMLEEEKEMDRIANLKELINDVQSFSEEYPDSTLDEYLQLVSLYGDKEENMSMDFVQLMTVHAAKGLEFDTVFVTGFSDGVFPSERAMSESLKGLEEERRLAYVAYTRARNKLYLCESNGFSYVLQKPRVKSRFIAEIDDEYIEHVGAIFDYGKPIDKPIEPVTQTRTTVTFDEPIARRDRWKKGDKVEHVKFGMGTVVNVSGKVLEIKFAPAYGIRKIAMGHTSIRKVEEASSSNSNASALYDTGMRVVHKVYGRGIIVKMDGDNMQVAFPYPAGVKDVTSDDPDLSLEQLLN